jgi:hypothetical protein
MKTSKQTCAFSLACLAVLALSSCGGSAPQPPPPVTYTIGGTVTNLASNDSVQLQDNGGDTLTVTANGSFAFGTTLTGGSNYNVTVSTQPSSPPQTCGVTNGTGTATANVTNVVLDCAHNEWTWTSGSNLVNQAGSYGTKGMPAPDNVPGPRWNAVSWIDASGNFWLFGGNVGNTYFLNDLWEYGNGEWTWISGSSALSQPGTYGVEGTPASGNVPGGRWGAVSWIDASGNFWLFGGMGYDSTGTIQGDLNDLWEYSNGEWTWMSGSNVADQPGSYGIEGTPASGNVPGGRWSAVSWIDASGDFWLFGGVGYDSTGTTQGNLNDLWKYSNGEWTWMGGSNVANQTGTYGTKGTPAPGNVPGTRNSAVSWTDANGNFWLFGGSGYDSTGPGGYLNDLWEYSNGEWTWVSGSNMANQAGTYGTEGTPASGNVPGARENAFSWIDSSGNFWLFGGYGLTAAAGGNLNDLWKYSAGEWAWVSGANFVNQLGTYGTEGTPAPGNIPGGRWGAVSWTDANGNLWLFGGYYDIATNNRGPLNDLWKYEP